LPSGKHRAVVRHGGAQQASEVVPTKAEARVLEAKLKLEMGSQPSLREQHSVGEVVAGYMADGQARLSPATLDCYRKGQRALPQAFEQRPVTTVTPLVLDSLYAELRAGGASEHQCQKVHHLLSASFNRAVRYGWLAARRSAAARSSSPALVPTRRERSVRPAHFVAAITPFRAPVSAAAGAPGLCGSDQARESRNRCHKVRSALRADQHRRPSGPTAQEPANARWCCAGSGAHIASAVTRVRHSAVHAGASARPPPQHTAPRS
jgi:hypothetical protein